MDLYIDKENVLSLIKNQDNKLYSDSLKTMQKQLNVNFNFTKETIASDEYLMAWFKFFTSNIGENNKQSFSADKFPVRPLKSNTSNTFDTKQLSSIYLIDDPDITKLINAGSVLIGAVGDEFEVFNQLFLLQNDYLFERELRIGEAGFTRWEDLEKFATPLTDIIIIDPYILKNGEVNANTIDVNLIHWLGIICSKSNVKINIVIVLNPNQMSYDIADIRTKILTRIEGVIGKKPQVTFIKTVKEHDRSIITNYIRITGNTFTYWNDAGAKITKGKEISVKSFAKIEFQDNAIKALADVQSIIEFALKNDGVEGDKICNFLSFS